MHESKAGAVVLDAVTETPGIQLRKSVAQYLEYGRTGFEA
jgi:hypothetical protein